MKKKEIFGLIAAITGFILILHGFQTGDTGGAAIIIAGLIITGIGIANFIDV